MSAFPLVRLGPVRSATEPITGAMGATLTSGVENGLGAVSPPHVPNAAQRPVIRAASPPFAMVITEPRPEPMDSVVKVKEQMTSSRATAVVELKATSCALTRAWRPTSESSVVAGSKGVACAARL